MPRLTHTVDVERGAWVRPLLTGWGRVTSQVPRGYDSYVRVFHEAEGNTWASVAARNGRHGHPLMQWSSISVNTDRPPAQGTLGEQGWAVLAGAIGGDPAVTAGLWVGYGNIGPNASVATVSLSSTTEVTESGLTESSAPLAGVVTSFGDVRSAPQLELPFREYALFTGNLSTLTTPTWRRESGWAFFWDETVNLLWPDDRSWFVASEIDFDSTIVGCTAETAQRILESGLEAAIVPADGDLSSTGDRVNL